MRLPTSEEINPIPKCLDGQVALKHFLGKTEMQTFEMFIENFEVYQEDLMFMGVPAFLFYFPAAIRYAESIQIRNDPYVASTMLMVMRYRFKYDSSAIHALVPGMIAYCEGVIGRMEQMDSDRQLYGNLKGKYKRFVRALRQSGAGPESSVRGNTP